MYFLQTSLLSSVKILQQTVYRINGASGSALKGIHFLSNNPTTNNKNIHNNLYICSVGYDQRLSLWSFNPEQFNNNNDNTPNTQQFQATDKNCPLIWNEGSMVNIGDVNSLAVSNSKNNNSDDSGKSSDSYISVIGEGFQIFRLS